MAVLLLVGLSACSWLPIPYTIDLRAQLGSNATGSASHEIEAGEAGDLDFRHPDGDGECIDFSEVDIPVTVESARLHFNTTVEYDGPRLTGTVAAQLYLSRDPERLWLPSNRVGPRVTVNLNHADTRLAGTAVLNREQIEGLNQQYLCWGLQIDGNNVTATESGEATIEYSVEELKLATRVSVI
ncbi:MAG TPA: hypothetical protein VF168_06100 [Trueperaceae bacterium]